jgi:hypothetical protein
MDIKQKLFTYLKMGVLMLFALFVSGVIKEEIFINNSPTFRPQVGSYLLARIQGIGGNGIDMMAFFKGKPSQNDEIGANTDTQVAERLGDVPLKAVSKGVYAKEDEKIKYTEVREDEVEWRVYTVNIKGKDVTIKVPADKARFTPQQVESLVGE